MEAAISVEQLRKVYGSITAVNKVSFAVQPGEIFGMVGPNGAGKTTTIECIEGLRQPDGGTISALGLSPQADGYALRQQIGVQLQTAALPARLKVWEALDLFASFYRRTVPWVPLLEQMGLAQKRNAYVAKLSGGQKQRLFITLALLNDPEIVFFDELTTGLDPQARHAMWDLVRSIQQAGKTVFLTTHFMEEAERLCHRVAILDAGKIIALDTPEQLIRDLNAENKVIFSVANHFDPAWVEAFPGISRVEQAGERVIIYGSDEKIISNVISALEAHHCRYHNLRTEQPTLEDVFLALTGRAVRD